jgi:tetratricopeptide (TPR) repeat protein
VTADDKEAEALAIVAERLEQEGEGILLIFDNAADAAAVKPYLPRGGRCNVLITSNTHAWRGIATPVEIGVWSKEVGADYLVARTGRTDEHSAAESLSETLGGLPLAHEQAAAYCERLEKPLAEYRKRFEAAPARILSDARDAPAEYHDRLTVTKTFGLAIDEAAKLRSAVEPLIKHAALLAPESIPLFLFEEGREKLGEPLTTELADDGLDEALAALRAFALVDRQSIADERDPEIVTETIRLHRLVRQVAADRCPDAERENARCALMRALAAVYPDEISDARTWPRARRLDALALALLEATPPEAVEEAAGRLLHGLGTYRQYALGAFAQARLFYERALALREKCRGRDHPDTAETLNNFALSLREEGDHEAARALLERALAINEKAFGPAHAATATSVNNLASLLREQGDLAAARPLLERALAGVEKMFGADHPATATSLGNLGLVLKDQGDLAAARALFERALAIDEKALGADHPDTANDVGNLAFLLKQAGDFGGARTFYERALTIYEKALGPTHPHTVASLANLASLLHDQGELAEARSCYERALAINEKTLGPNDPAIAVSLNNLAGLLQDQGDSTSARPLLERALSIAESVLGSAHPNTNRLRSNLAKALLSIGDIAGAEKLGAAALAAHESALGPSHPWTLDTAGVAAQALDAAGRSGEAAELRQRFGLDQPALQRSTG